MKSKMIIIATTLLLGLSGCATMNSTDSAQAGSGYTKLLQSVAGTAGVTNLKGVVSNLAGVDGKSLN